MNEELPLVSIAIPCYNHEKYVEETIQSVIDQDYKNIELIVIDDGSTDNSVEVIQKMKLACEERFSRFEFRHRENKGLCNTLNEALKWCHGEFFSPVASDDILLTYKTRIQVEYLKNNFHSIGVFGGIEQLVRNESIIKLGENAKYHFNDILLHKHGLPAPTQMLRAEKVKSVGGFNGNFIIEDWSMWLSLTENGGTLDYLSIVFAKYRKHDGNTSGRHDVMIRGRKQVLDVYITHNLYKRAYSRSLLISAHEIQAISRSQSIFLACNAIKHYPLCMFSRTFIGLTFNILGLNKKASL